MQRQLAGAIFEGPEEAPEPARLYRFRTAEGNRLVVGWSTGEPCRLSLPEAPVEAVGRDGEGLARPGSSRAEVTSAPRYFHLR